MATKSILSTAWIAYGNKMGTILKYINTTSVTQILIFTHLVVFLWSLTDTVFKKKIQKQVHKKDG